MKYILFIMALTLAVGANAQTGLQHTPGGAAYQIITHGTGDKVKLNDVITFDFIQKTDKDSVLMSSYVTGSKAQVQVVEPTDPKVKDFVEQNLMQVLPLLSVNDSLVVKFPTDSIFKGHDDQRPAFFPKGSNLNFALKIERTQPLDQAIAERNASIAKQKAADSVNAIKYKTTENANITQYLTSHKLVMKTTTTGLKYVITVPSVKAKPLAGDTVLVNYTGRTLNDKVFDSSIEADAKAAQLNQPGRTYEPLQFVIGAGGIIPGWEEAFLLINEGAKAKLVIPFSLAYGEQSPGPEIPPYSTLEFDVELVKVKPIKHPEVAKPAPAPVHHTVHKKTAASNN